MISKQWRSALLTLGLSLGVVACTVSLSPVASAQTSISGDITGVVTDSTGAVIPNATVTVTSVQRGQVKTATSNASGQYRVSLLSPGDYQVVVSAASFNKATVKVTVSAA